MATKKPASKSTGSKKKVSASSSTRSNARKKSTSTRTRRKRTPAKSKASSQPRFSSAQKALIAGVLFLFATAVLALSLLAPDQGSFTAWLSSLLARGFGLGRFIIPGITGFIGVYLVMRGMDQQPQVPVYRLIGFGVLFTVFLAFAALLAVGDAGDVYATAANGQGGGYTGALLADVLDQMLGNWGAILTLAVLGIVGAVLLSGINRKDVGGWLERLNQPAPAEENTLPVGERVIRINPGRAPAEPKPEPGPTQMPLIVEEEPAAAEAAKPSAKPAPPSRTRRPARPATPPAETTADPIYVGSAAGNSGAAVAHVPLEADDYSWTLPSIDAILESGTDLDMNNASIREQVEIIEQTLESFGAPATVVEINQGPTITQFGVEPNYLVARNGKRTKVKVGKIASLADDLALALAARSIRIQAPVPGKGYVGIEVPNTAKALVSLRDVMESPEYAKIKSPLRTGLGQNVAGTPIGADLAAMPHLLIAGTTGSGKSVCVNAIIASLLLQNTPDDLKLVMVDPKRVELTGYNGIPHLAAPVVVEMDRVIGTLQWAQREMDHRYKLFAEVGARNITDYNKKTSRKKDRQKMPYVVIIVDELADLMMLAPEDTERGITRLAQMARATGIHMVIATQRPSVDVVTGLIKANFPARIAFAVASSTDSRVILDSTGAERLLGQGDMLFQSPDAAAPVRLQGCFVSDTELQNLIQYWRTARRSQIVSAADSVSPQPGAEATADLPVGQPVREASAEVAPPVVQMDRPATTRPDTTPEPDDKTAEPEATAPATAKPSPRPSPPAPRDPDSITPEPAPVTAEASEPVVMDVEPEEEAETPPAPVKPSPSSGGALQQPLWEALQEMDEEAANPPVEIDDDLMPEAVALVRKLNKASTSLLQRRFRIGYTRAARMIDAMEELGIIGPPTGTSKAREVYPPGDDDPFSGGEAAA